MSVAMRKDRGHHLFKFAVILVHAIIYIAVTIIGLGGKFNPAPLDPGATYGVWFTTLAIFNILVILSALVQLRIKKVSIFLLLILGLIILFLITLQYIYPFFYELF